MNDVVPKRTPRSLRSPVRHILEIARREETRIDVGLASIADESGARDAVLTFDANGEPSSNEIDRPWGACPHIDRIDERCGHRFSIGRIEQAFNVCFGSFHTCPQFHRFNSEIAINDGEPRSSHPTLVEVRIIRRNDVRQGKRTASETRQRGAIGSVEGVAGLRRTGS